MNVLMITGSTGVGKSKLIEDCVKGNFCKFLVFDSFVPGRDTWIPPLDVSTVDIVVFDHVAHWQDAIALQSAVDWCAEHQKSLWLVEQGSHFITRHIPSLKAGELELGLPYGSGCHYLMGVPIKDRMSSPMQSLLGCLRVLRRKN